MTDEEIATLRALLAPLLAITEHPVEVETQGLDAPTIYVHSIGETCGERRHTYYVPLAEIDTDWKNAEQLAQALVALVNAAPTLLAELEKLRAELGRLREG